MADLIVVLDGARVVEFGAHAATDVESVPTDYDGAETFEQITGER